MSLSRALVRTSHWRTVGGWRAETVIPMVAKILRELIINTDQIYYFRNECKELVMQCFDVSTDIRSC